MSNKKTMRIVKKVIKDNRRALVGFAHFDKGIKIKGCDCCYCNPEEKK